ncbi:MAG TPA: hypothetical protein VFC79_05535 [Tissierellaceae bacterium]|nr:hypothetical protein [Tissierellaceae bacterium]
MKNILKYFLDNLKMTASLISIILGCAFLIFLFLTSLEFVIAMFASPVVAFIVGVLLIIIVFSVLSTLFDMFSNKSD